MADEDRIIERLRGISSDEKQEMGKMRCRIDDQARLIMMLKKRNDEYIVANMSLDKHVVELERQIEELRDELDHEQSMKDSIERLERTIEQLKESNFQWEIKDEQTRQRLVFNHEQRQSLEQQISSLKEQIKTMDKSIQESNVDTDRLRLEWKYQLMERDKRIDEQRVELFRLEELEGELKEKDRQLSRMDEVRLNEVSEASKSGQQWQRKANQLEKRLSESVAEREKLVEQIAQGHKLLFDANQRFINEEERVNGDFRVKQLEQQLRDKQQRLETLEQEFVGYKNYTASLLNKEKHLNERLQQLFAGRTS